MEETREKTPVETVKTTPDATPELKDFNKLQWQSSKTKIPRFKFISKWSWAFTKEAALTPLAEAQKLVIRLAPEEVRKENLALAYAAEGITPKAIDQTLEELEPESPEAKYWQNLKAIYKTEKPLFVNLFEHYYERKRLGKIIAKKEVLASSRVVRTITFGRFNNFVELKTAFWQNFKQTRFGGFLSKRAGKLIKMAPKFAKLVGAAGAALTSWETFKKVGKAALAAIAAIFMWAAHYGAAAVAGATAGLLAGVPLGIKTGLMTFSALSPFIGPFAAIPGVIVGFVTWVATTFVGALGGVGLQMLLDKAGIALGRTSVAEASTTSFTQTGLAATSAAKWFVPVATTGTLVGGILSYSVLSGAFVIPTEKGPSPWMGQSEYIRVEKSVTFKNQVNPTNIGNNEINENTVFIYQFTITAKEATLTNIKAEDNITTILETGTNLVETKVWSDIPDLEANESWTSEPYEIRTNPVDKFKDSILTNTVTVTADVTEEDLTGEQSFASTTIIIGNPPQDCPNGWPVDVRPIVITQGPRGTFSHSNQEAIDIGRVGNTTPVKATHKGTAHTGRDPGKGRYVSISSTCRGVVFTSLYAHLGTISVGDGEPVIYGQQIGVTDNTGISTGPHLHYEFRSPGNQIKMAPPNIPAAVPYGSRCTDENPCIYQ